MHLALRVGTLRERRIEPVRQRNAKAVRLGHDRSAPPQSTRGLTLKTRRAQILRLVGEAILIISSVYVAIVLEGMSSDRGHLGGAGWAPRAINGPRMIKRSLAALDRPMLIAELIAQIGSGLRR